MMKDKNYFKSSLLALIIVVSILGCSKKMDRYEDPPWLGGTNIETLEKAGNFTIFLELMKKAGFDKTIEKQLTTLFVPTDDAFKAYFQQKGIASVAELSKDQATELFALHYLPNPVNATHLVYEKAWKRLEGPTGEYRSLFFRKLTRSVSASYIEVPKYDPNYKDQELYILTNPKYVPLFSKFFFEDYNGDGAVDYPFMYPESTWGGLLQWHNAKVIPPKGKENTTNIEDLANATASGFIYYIDKVVGTMPNVDQYLLANQDKYSLFYDLLQRFAVYAAAGADITGKSLYSKVYTDISDLNHENGANNASTQTYAWMLDIYTVFAPDNALLQSYLDNTVLKSYSSLDEVPKVTLRYILQSQITNRLELKSKFTKIFFNVYGDRSVIDPNDVEPGYMCSNGVVYKSKKILEPNAFLRVPGPLFFTKNYGTFLTLLTNTNLITSLSGDTKMTIFAPPDDMFEQAGIQLIQNAEGVMEFQEKTKDSWVTYDAVELGTFAQDHIYIGDISDLSGEGYIEMMSHNFVHYSANKLNGGKNSNKANTANVVNNEARSNGTLFYIDKPLETRYRMGQYIVSDPNLSEFANLMVKTGMLELNFQEELTRNVYPNIALTEAAGAFYWTAFVPDNAAVKKAITEGLDTAANSASLKSFVNYHFVKKTIFDDGKLSGTFGTLLDGSSLRISNSVNNLAITDATGQVVAVNHADADHIVRRGVVHKITSVLKYK